MRIVFDDQAVEDLRSIHAWIGKNSVSTANALVERIFNKVEALLEPELTYMGRPGLDPRTHELIEYPYIIVYEVHEEQQMIVILSIVHGAQKRKPNEP